MRNAHFMHGEALDTAPQVFSALGLEKPFLVGHSDGGSIALLFAAHFLSGTSGVAVMAPHCFVEDISVRAIEAAKTQFETTDLPHKLAKFHRDSPATFYGWNDVWLSSAFRSWNIEAELATIRCPVLAIQGERDEYGTMAQIDAIQSQIPAAQLLKIPDCGHAPWKDAREKTLREIVNFYRNCAAGI